MTRAVFIGSSNSQTGTWPEILCARQGWTCHNFSIGGGGYAETSPSSFLNQATNAVAGVSSPETVEYVFVTDASNDIRGGRPVGAHAPQVFQKLRDGFPNARVIVVPVLWNHTTMNVENLDRRLGVTQRVAEIREAAIPTGVEVIEWSWLWHWNSLQWDDVNHFTPAGYLRVVQFVERYLRGVSTDSPFPWTSVQAQHPSATTWPVRTKREGDLVTVVGNFTLYANFGKFIDLGKFHPAVVPVDKLQIPVVGDDQQVYSTTLYPDGTWRSWSALAARTYSIHTTYPTL